MQPQISIEKQSDVTLLKLFTLLSITVLIPSICALLFTVQSQHNTITRLVKTTAKEKAEINYELTRYKVAQAQLVNLSTKTEESIHNLRLNTPRFKLYVFFELYYPHMDQETRLEYTEHLLTYGKKFSVDPLLMACIIKRESNWDPNALGPEIPNKAKSLGYRAHGLTQIIPGWHQEKIEAAGYDSKEALFIPEVAIKAGSWAYREFLDRNNNNPWRALTAYVGGSHPKYNQAILTSYTRVSLAVYSIITNNNKDPQKLFNEESQLLAYLK